MNIKSSWERRPTEVANLYNPAYFAILINQISAGYESKVGKPIPYPVVFLALPIVLHPPSISLLPKSSVSKLHVWLQQNPELLFNFAERAKNLSPFVRESISFGISNNVLLLDNTGRILAQPVKALKAWEEKPLPRLAVKQSALVGKLLGQVSDVPNLFSMFGVSP